MIAPYHNHDQICLTQAETVASACSMSLKGLSPFTAKVRMSISLIFLNLLLFNAFAVLKLLAWQQTQLQPSFLATKSCRLNMQLASLLPINSVCTPTTIISKTLPFLPNNSWISVGFVASKCSARDVKHSYSVNGPSSDTFSSYSRSRAASTLKVTPASSMVALWYTATTSLSLTDSQIRALQRFLRSGRGSRGCSLANATVSGQLGSK